MNNEEQKEEVAKKLRNASNIMHSVAYPYKALINIYEDNKVEKLKNTIKYCLLISQRIIDTVGIVEHFSSINDTSNLCKTLEYIILEHNDLPECDIENETKLTASDILLQNIEALKKIEKALSDNDTAGVEAVFAVMKKNYDKQTGPVGVIIGRLGTNIVSYNNLERCISKDTPFDKVYTETYNKVQKFMKDNPDLLTALASINDKGIKYLMNDIEFDEDNFSKEIESYRSVIDTMLKLEEELLKEI